MEQAPRNDKGNDMKPCLIIILLLAGCATETERPRAAYAELISPTYTMDIAAIESPAPLKPVSWRRGADLTGDGRVNLLDLAIMAYWWGSEYVDNYWERVERLETRLTEVEARLRIVDPNWFDKNAVF